MTTYYEKMTETKAELGSHIERVIVNLFKTPKIASAVCDIPLATLNKMIGGKGKYTIERYFEVLYKLGQDVSIVSDSRDYLMSLRDFNKCIQRGGFIDVASISSEHHFYKSEV